MRLSFSRYILEPRATLSAVAQPGGREGALIRLEEVSGVGFADLHPWVELGDEPLDRQLESLRAGRLTPLSRRTLELARLDLDARSRGVSAFDGLEIPLSHLLVTDIQALSETRLGIYAVDGYRHLKVKLGHSFVDEAALVNKLISSASGREFKWRLDFNGVLRAEEFLSFASKLSLAAREAIEFVEDPVPFNIEEWARLQDESGLALALDRYDANREFGAEHVGSAARWLIVKPAVQDPGKMLRLARQYGLNAVFTSYLDHPVGQVGAALEAARAQAGKLSAVIGGMHSFNAAVGVCGLVSHFAYKPNEFSERLVVENARLLPPEGFGIGFDKLLAQREWRTL